MNNRDEKKSLLSGIGARVRALRLGDGLTVREFAERAALSPRFINQLEAGKGNISIARLARVAEGLGRTLPDLIPPPEDDRSLRIRTWRLLSECSDDDWQALYQWLEKRRGHQPVPSFITLIGLRGAGKSTIGGLLAKQLKKPFVELDQWIEEAAGLPIGEIFATHGESYYRRLEREALERLFATSDSCIFAPGGSVVTDAESWELIKRRCFTVWLHATPIEYMNRMRRQGDTRPMLGRPKAMAELKALLQRREPLYAESRLVIKTTGLSPSNVVKQIAKGVRSFAGV
ncbi:MAG: helix-turn-helix domain-containing protein [Acidobacteria bacterium]|nr:helix-turn-helix domain-containing protein [Acidobacteriota bacterium]